MEHLDHTGAADALRRRFAAGAPIIGICLGMQLAVDFSEEDGGVEGLGLVAGRVRRLATERVPRLGWALVEPWGEAFYFAHSYAVESDAAVATSEGVTAAIASGSFVGVQFHPKSGPAGERWVKTCLTPA
jgi:glutamine amidotransferase